MRRGAEAHTEKGSCLFEPQASLHETPAGLSTGGCPSRSGGTQAPGSPFLCLLSLGEEKKVSRPPQRQSGIGIQRRNSAQFKRRLRQALPERMGNKASTGSARTGGMLNLNGEKKLRCGRFEGQSTNSPSLRLALRVLRFAAQ